MPRRNVRVARTHLWRQRFEIYLRRVAFDGDLSDLAFLHWHVVEVLDANLEGLAIRFSSSSFFFTIVDHVSTVIVVVVKT